MKIWKYIHMTAVVHLVRKEKPLTMQNIQQIDLIGRSNEQ